VSPSAHIWPEKFPVILATIYSVIEPPESAVQALLVPLLVSGVYVPFRRLLPSPLNVPVTLKTLPFSVNVNCTCESGDVTVPSQTAVSGSTLARTAELGDVQAVWKKRDEGNLIAVRGDVAIGQIQTILEILSFRERDLDSSNNSGEQAGGRGLSFVPSMKGSATCPHDSRDAV